MIYDNLSRTLSMQIMNQLLVTVSEKIQCKVPEFESTVLSTKKKSDSSHWAKLEPLSEYFNSIEISTDKFMFGIFEEDSKTIQTLLSI